MRLNRRDFLKPLGAAVVARLVPGQAVAQTGVPHAEKLPVTPFDAPEGTWSLAVFPDTQNLTRSAPEVLRRQCEWVVAHREKHALRFVMQLGDITDINSVAEWENARQAFRILRDGGVPFSLLPGNHDLGKGGAAQDRTTLMNDYFTPDDYRNSQSHGLFEAGRMENSWHTLDTPWGKFLLIALEFGPRDAVLAWAGEAAAKHPDHTAVVSSHAHLFYDSTRYDWAKFGKAQTWNPKDYALAREAEKAGGVNDGEDVWKKLLAPHKNIRFMFNGHVLGSGTGYRVDEGAHGQRVHQMLANYQAGVDPRRPFHGGGFFRLLQFLPDKKTVRVRTYSPWLDQWLTEPNQQFEMTL
jgi:3',5'-cyclic AMP phosphodiesterase CpdA